MSHPPPLPRQLLQFKFACWIGLLLGVVQSALWGIVFALSLIAPPDRFPVVMLFICAGAALQTVSAAFLFRNLRWASAPFALASVLVAFCYLAVSALPFAIFNIVPVILLVLSATPTFSKSPRAANDPTPEPRRKDDQDLY
jgi:hypothetical protein